jgi:hypothetical protein
MISFRFMRACASDRKYPTAPRRYAAVKVKGFRTQASRKGEDNGTEDPGTADGS